MNGEDKKYCYLAGIIDGEGTIGVYLGSIKRKDACYRNYTVQLSIANTNYLLMEFLKSNFGGHIMFRSATKDNGKVVYMWRARLDEIRFILPRVIPFLILKKEQAKIVVEFLDILKKVKELKKRKNSPELDSFNKRRREICSITKVLNKKGVI